MAFDVTKANRNMGFLEECYLQRVSEASDRRYVLFLPPSQGWIIRIFRRQVNLVAKAAICRAHERGHIDSAQLHDIAAILDRMLWPERH